MNYEKLIRKDTRERVRATLKGRIGEQLAPLLPMFKYEPADARFIGSPIDYVIFDGLKEGEPRKIIFLEVKTGKTPALSQIQEKIEKLVKEKLVEYEILNIEKPDASIAEGLIRVVMESVKLSSNEKESIIKTFIESIPQDKLFKILNDMRVIKAGEG